MHARASIVFVLTSVLVACAQATPPPPSTPPPAAVNVLPPPSASAKDAIDSFAPGARAAADGIRPEALASHIRFLADDLLEGREPGTRGFELGARYVASELQALGLTPAGDDGTFFQKTTLIGRKVKSASLEIDGGSGRPLRLVPDKEFVGSASRVNLSGELVFAGYGLVAPEYRYDDFAGSDVRGKIAVELLAAPRTDRADFFPALASAVFGDARRKIAELKRRGAIAVIGVMTPEFAALFPFAAMVQNFHFESMMLVDTPDLPWAVVDVSTFDKLLKKAGRSETTAQLVDSANRQATHAFSLGLKAKLRLDMTERTVKSENVVAYVPSDPASPTKDEMVMYGAHLDHLGIGDPVNGDTIYNGASDDAAGMASLLETARAFTHLARPPRRKILFLFVTGEERGLLGSSHLAEHPTVPLHDIVADIDVDDAYPTAPIHDVVPLGTDESTLAIDAERAALALGLKAGRDRRPEQASFVRSDNYSFVKKGIPAAQLMRGTLGMTPAEKDATDAFWGGRYHQPQDEYEPNRDWRPFADFTRFSFLLGLSIAQRADRPAWNPQSFFRRFPEKAR